MNGLFITKKDIIQFDLYLTFTEEKGLIVLEEKDQFIKEGVNDIDITKYTFTFRKPSYKDYVDILSSQVSAGIEGINIDPVNARYSQFVNLISEWSLVNEGGERVEPNKENIDKLNPKLAIAIMDKLDSLL
jgi:hypothetical protein